MWDILVCKGVNGEVGRLFVLGMVGKYKVDLEVLRVFEIIMSWLRKIREWSWFGLLCVFWKFVSVVGGY